MICRDCKHGVVPAGVLRKVSTALTSPKPGVYVHGDRRACGYFISRTTSFLWLRRWWARVPVRWTSDLGTDLRIKGRIAKSRTAATRG
jgi:hypothetical protein